MMHLKIPMAAASVIDALVQNGYEAYAVGGCVRDALLGREPNDWDVTTSARPETIMDIFSSREGFRAVPTGIAHGTVTVVAGGEPIEVTTYRIDGEYSDSRHPDRVEFTDDLAADLSRRDFTVNAMAYSPERGLVDEYGGTRDLEARIIRCVGDAHDRFSEDALRIMRALRFAAQLGFVIDKDTADAANGLARLLDNIAKERITSELSGLLLGRDAATVMRAHAKILSHILYVLDEDAILSASERVSRICDASLPLLLAALLANAADNGACEFFARLRFDNKTARATKSILAHKNSPICDKISVKRLCRDVGADIARDVIVLKCAMGENADAALEYLQEILDGGECYSVAQLKIDGRELLSLGYEPITLGKTLDAMLEAVVSGQLQNEKNELINAACAAPRKDKPNNEGSSSL